MNKKIIIFILIGAILMTIPLTVLLTQRKQEVRTRANASTTLSFSPTSTTTSPIQKFIGDPISVDIMVNPGTNMVTFVKFQILFDATKVALSTTNPFVPNTAAFPITIEGPVIGSNTLAASLSVGSDPTKAIQTTTKLGTLNFIALAPTSGTTTQIRYTSLTQVLSIASTDQAGENVLSTTTPAIIAINPIPTVTPTPTPTPLPTETPTPTPTPLPTETPTPTPTPTPANTFISVTVYQHGIYNSGDNTNPTDTNLSNKTPLRQTILATLEVYNTANQLVAGGTDIITYSSAVGNYKGTIQINPNVPTGSYSLKVKTPNHLKRLVPGILTINLGQTNIAPAVTLITGDANDDNQLNIIDYNSLLDCYSDFEAPVACDTDKKLATDFNDDGFVNQVDYNLFLREIVAQPGV